MAAGAVLCDEELRAINRVLPAPWTECARQRCPPGRLLDDVGRGCSALGKSETPEWLMQGSHGDAPLPPSRLPASLRRERTLVYDAARHRLVEAVRSLLLTPQQLRDGVPLDQLHTLPADDRPPATTPPVLWKARVAAGMVPQCTRAEAKRRRKWWAKCPARRRVEEEYRSFVRDVVAPDVAEQMGDGRLDLVYQHVLTLRVVFPSSPAAAAAGVTPCVPHRDADYRHQAEEVNVWTPLTAVAGACSLYTESEPGLADWHALEAAAPTEDRGVAISFWGNQCRHFTLPNTRRVSRVSFDCRVVPPSLWCDSETVGPDGAQLRIGAYYQRLPPGSPGPGSRQGRAEDR